MKKFKCIKRHKETGINWSDETRIYRFTPTFFSYFNNITTVLKLDNIGEFYFNARKKSFPLEGDGNFKPFDGKKIFKWIEENSTGKVLICCRRDYGYEWGCDSDDRFYISVRFSHEEDAVAFKLWWS